MIRLDYITWFKFESGYCVCSFNHSSCKPEIFKQYMLYVCGITEQGRSQDFSKGGSQQGHHPGIADFIWFIPLLSLVYRRAQSYYRGMKAHIN